MEKQGNSVVVSQPSTMIKWPWWKKILIASGEGGEAVCQGVFSTYFSIYCTDVIGIGAGVVSLITWIAKIWDAANDVIIGVLSDRTRTRLGRYRPWIMSSAFCFILVMVMIFTNNPNWPVWAKILYATLGYCAYTWVYTMFYIPWLSLQATLTQDPNERASMGSLRIALAVGASWFIGTIAPGMFSEFQKTMSVPASYTVVALVAALIGAPFILISGIVSKEHIRPAEDTKQKAKREKIPWKTLFGLMRTNKYLVAIAIGTLAGQLFQNGRNTAIMYYFTYRMENLALLPIFITLFRLPMMIGNLTSQYFVKWTGSKGKVIAWSYVICTVTLMAASFVDTLDNLVPFFVINSIAHYFIGVGYAVCSVAIADTVDYVEYLTGKRMEGLISALVSFFNKLGAALGISVVPLVLAITGYVPNVAQTPQAITGIMACMYYIPAVFALISAVVFFGYKLDNKRMKEIVASLQESRAKAAMPSANTENEDPEE